MASMSRITGKKRSQKTQRSGHRRKRALAKKSTLSYEELFAAVGPPPSDPQAK